MADRQALPVPIRTRSPCEDMITLALDYKRNTQHATTPDITKRCRKTQCWVLQDASGQLVITQDTTRPRKAAQYRLEHHKTPKLGMAQWHRSGQSAIGPAHRAGWPAPRRAEVNARALSRLRASIEARLTARSGDGRRRERELPPGAGRRLCPSSVTLSLFHSSP